MNDIKTYQIQIANYFRIPVDPLNFSVNYNKKEHNKGFYNLTQIVEVMIMERETKKQTLRTQNNQNTEMKKNLMTILQRITDYIGYL